MARQFALFAADSARRELEHPQLEEQVRERAAAVRTEGQSDESFKAILSIIRDNEQLRANLSVRGGAEKTLSKNERTALLNIIGALVELIQTPKEGRRDVTSVITELVENYGDKYGISESNLSRKFPVARRSLTGG
jgi:hypothetical protein